MRTGGVEPPSGGTADRDASWVAAERTDAVRARRRIAGVPEEGEAWGLALSGGGIRSATFCLGLIRGLARNRLLRRFDYLSTVSGGGYVGASLGRLFRSGVSAEEIERGVGSERSIWLWWLRTNGRYLTPSGVRDLGHAAVSIARGVVATQLELGILLILLASVLVLPHVLIALSPEVAAWASTSSPPFSAWLLLLPVPFFLGTRCLFAYWLTRPHPVPGGTPMMAVYAVALAMISTCLFGLDQFLALFPPHLTASVYELSDWLRIGLATLALAASVAMILGIADVVSLRKAYGLDRRNGGADIEGADTDAQRQARIDAEYALRRLRLIYTKRLLTWTLVLLALIGVAALDWVSWELAKLASRTGGSKLVYGSAGLAAFGLVLCRALQPVLQDWKSKHPGHQISLERMLGLLVFGLLLLIVVAWASFVHALVLPEALWTYAGEGGDVSLRYRPLLVWVVVFAASLSFVALTRDSYDIVNMGSLHGYYRARIERAYVSSGNAGGPQARFERDPLASVDAGQSKIRPPDEVVDGDDTRLADYAPQAAGGPIHLINCCINQTVDDGSRYFNGDRKGVALTLSSLGGVEIDAYPPAHAASGADAPDLGYLSKWIAISGAAAGTGMGSQTSPAYSALLFLSGMRLGYWEPCLSPDHRGRRADAPQPEPPGLIRRLPLKVSAIVSELLGQFPGLSHGAWYLSDGGHFENTGIYPLIKRELALIVAADCGADPKYLFEDLESMIRKVRIDFGAEIEFIAPQHVDKNSAPGLIDYLGTPESIGPEPSNACLLLGRVRYRSGRIGTLLVAKPRRLEHLPFDVMAYADRHPKYPQQSTGDQFFDESQWESYQKLGALIGGLLTPNVIAQAQAVVQAGTLATSSLTGAQNARTQTSSRMERLRPMVTATAAGTGLGLSLAVAIWQGFGDYRDQNRAALEKQAELGKALIKNFADGSVPPRAAQIIGDLKQADIEGEGSYADVIAALDDCDRRDVLACASLKLTLAQRQAGGERDYWLTFHAVKPERVIDAEARVAMLAQAGDSKPAIPEPSVASAMTPVQTAATVATATLATAAAAIAAAPAATSAAGVEPSDLEPAVAAMAPSASPPAPAPVVQAVPPPSAAQTTADTSIQAAPVDAPPTDAHDASADIAATMSAPGANVLAQPSRPQQTTATASRDPKPQQSSPPVARDRSARTAVSAKTATVVPVPNKQACKGRRIFLHIYDEQSRPAANCIANEITKLGQRPVGVENVVATAIRRGERSPWVWRKVAVLDADADNDGLSVCVKAMAAYKGIPSGTQFKPLAAGLRAKRDVVEIWLPPNTSPRLACSLGTSAKSK